MRGLSTPRCPGGGSRVKPRVGVARWGLKREVLYRSGTSVRKWKRPFQPTRGNPRRLLGSHESPRGGRQTSPWGRLGPKNGHCSYQTSSNRSREIVNFGAQRRTPTGLSPGLPLVSGGDEAPLGVWGVAHTPWGRACDRPDAKWVPNTHQRGLQNARPTWAQNDVAVAHRRTPGNDAHRAPCLANAPRWPTWAAGPHRARFG